MAQSREQRHSAPTRRCAIKLLTTLTAVLLISGTTFSATIYVPDDYPTIQDAIYAATQGDMVIVRSGTYYENVFHVKEITVVSENGPEDTIIDGGQLGSVVRFGVGVGADAILDGFTITNGWGEWISDIHSFEGGGVLCYSSSPTIRNNVITDNQNGAVFCFDSSSMIDSNVVAHNDAYGILAMLWYGSSCSVTIKQNVVLKNSGIGIECASGWDNPMWSAITNNIVTENNNSGISVTGDKGLATIANNVISGNTETNGGGGISFWTATAVVVNNSIVGNSAKWGGGIMCIDLSDVTISNTILWENRASEYGQEILVGGWPTVSQVTISDSDVKGGQSSVYVDQGSTLNWGSGMIDENPLFFVNGHWDDNGTPGNPTDDSWIEGDDHLTWNSPCRDAGDDSVVTELVDFEGDPRIALGTVDMGADEYYYHLYHTGDVIPGAPIDLKVVGYPTAPVLLALGSAIQDPPLSTQHGDLWLNWPPLWQGNIGVVPSDGVLVLPATVPSGWSTGEEHYLQSLIGPWGGPYTRLSNLLTLTVE